MLLATITHVAPSYRWLTSSLRAPLYSESFNLHGRLRGSGRTSRSVQGLERMTTPERQPWKEMGFYRWCERRILCTKKTTPTHQQPRFHNPEAVPMASSYAASRTEVGPAEPRAISSRPDYPLDVVRCRRTLEPASGALRYPPDLSALAVELTNKATTHLFARRRRLPMQVTASLTNPLESEEAARSSQQTLSIPRVRRGHA